MCPSINSFQYSLFRFSSHLRLISTIRNTKIWVFRNLICCTEPVYRLKTRESFESNEDTTNITFDHASYFIHGY